MNLQVKFETFINLFSINKGKINYNKMKITFKQYILSIVMLFLLSTVITSCDNLGKKYNSSNCIDRLDVKLKDGSAVWVYNGGVTEGYVKGRDEQGRKTWIPMTNIESITEVDCVNGK